LASRRIKIALAIAGGCAVAYALLPVIVADRVHHALDARGFPEATFDVAAIGLDHLRLRDVHLAPGADIAEVELDRGLSLLWRDLDDITLRGARISTEALASIGSGVRASSGGAPRFGRVAVEDAVVTREGQSAAVDGSASARGDGLDLEVTIREPVPRGWTVKARGHVVLGRGTGRDIELERGHVELDLPRRDVGGVRVERASLSAVAAGNLSTMDLTAKGTARGNVSVGSLSVTGARVPFSYDREGLHVRGARAKVSGGELAFEPFTIGKGRSTIVARARGLQLRTLAGATGRLSATGLVDGDISLVLDDTGLNVRRASLRARDGGTLKVLDSEWRARIAKLQSPLAVHAAIAGALSDFEFSELAAELAPRTGAGPDLRVTTRGRGRRNHQPLDIAIAIRGFRDALPRLTRGTQ
jgi:hypothetical protein